MNCVITLAHGLAWLWTRPFSTTHCRRSTKFSRTKFPRQRNRRKECRTKGDAVRSNKHETGLMGDTRHVVGNAGLLNEPKFLSLAEDGHRFRLNQ
jgi:hypothetical protein